MGIKFTGIDTPFGGVSWEYTENESNGIKELFYFLEAKRVLVNPADMEKVSWCGQSSIEIRNKLTELLSKYSFSNDSVNDFRDMVNACNAFLDNMEKVDEQGILYKNGNGDWESINFSKAMKQFRKVFREKIALLSERYRVEFSKVIPEEY